MRLSELSEATGQSIATIKYYLREGLLPPGRDTGVAKRAEYGPEHARRVRLIRVLTEVGGLPLTAVRATLAAIDQGTLSTHDMLGAAHGALGLTTRATTSASDLETSRSDVATYLDRLGWHISAAQEPATQVLAEALAALRDLGWNCDAEIFAPYAELAFTLAERELATIPIDAPREQTVEAVVVGTVVFEAAFVALRRLAQAHHSARRFSR